jgi:hypothetical protein
LAGRDALEVEPGQQLLDVPRPPQERRQHLRGEADRLAATVAAVAHAGPAHGDRADAGLDLPRGRVPVAHHAPPAVGILELDVRRQERLDLGLDDLLQHPPRPCPQHRQQRIFGDARPWPRQPDNGILLHGVSSPVRSNITEDTPPPASSTKFGYSPGGSPRWCVPSTPTAWEAGKWGIQ